MKRRALLVNGGQAFVFALGTCATPSSLLSLRQESRNSSDNLEQRIAAVIQAYDAQGNHRTATEVDRASAEWLANQMRLSGAEPSLEPFTLSRIDPQSCYLRVAGRRFDSLPLFDAGFTGPEGVHGRLGHLGSDSEIALIESEPPSFSDPGISVPTSARPDNLIRSMLQTMRLSIGSSQLSRRKGSPWTQERGTTLTLVER